MAEIVVTNTDFLRLTLPDAERNALGEVVADLTTLGERYALQVNIKSISGDATGYVIVPEGGDGVITEVAAVADNTTDNGAIVLTPSIADGVGGAPVAVAGGVVTIPNATAAGRRFSARPTAANAVHAGDVVSVVKSGSSTASGWASVTLSVRRSS